jgi:hypothetical protein
MARQGKIARLPHRLREQVNRRLLDGEISRTILKWLNAQDDAVEVWESLFEGAAANPQNLSEWRTGGYKEWIQRRQKSENLKTLASYASDLAKAGGSISDGAAAIAAGHVLEALENAATDEDVDLSTMVKAVTALQKADLAKRNFKLNQRKESNREKVIELSKDKFEKQTIETFMKWAKTKEAQAILTNGKPKQVQMGMLREMIFGVRKEGDE